jgi:acyl carrier protein|tara:strand:+ start:954 stop:1196 length:243 start_codon:yes stop_codon:yes gene_type:complete
LKKFNESDLFEILKTTFPDTDIPKNVSNLKMGSIKKWDSLGNFNLLLAIEDQYDIRFSLNEISEIKSIQMIIKALNERSI